MLQALCVLYVLEMFIAMESFGVHKLYGAPTICTTNKISVWSQYTNKIDLINFVCKIFTVER